MQFTSVLVSLILANAVVAGSLGTLSHGGDHGHGNNSTTGPLSNKDLCGKMQDFRKVIGLAANESRLNDKTGGDPAKIEDIKAKADDAKAKLEPLSANTTLVNFCKVLDECHRLAGLENVIDTAANDTKLNEKFKNDVTKIAAFKEKAVAAQTELDALKLNTTLVAICDTPAFATNSPKRPKSDEKPAEPAATVPLPAHAAQDGAATPSASVGTITTSRASFLNAHTGFLSTIFLVTAGVMVL